MGKMKFTCVHVGMLPTNCYIGANEETKEAVIIDPGDNAAFLANCMDGMGLDLKAILLTHAHFDHILAVPELKAKYDVPIYVSRLDAPMLSDADLNLGGVEIQLSDDDVLLDGGEVLNIAGMEFQVIATPGHTPGGLCFYLEDDKVLFAGDTMFRYSWGRTDFPGGSEEALMSSIREKLLPLPEDTMVYPGHEGATRIGDERKLHQSYGNYQ